MKLFLATLFLLCSTQAQAQSLGVGFYGNPYSSKTVRATATYTYSRFLIGASIDQLKIGVKPSMDSYFLTLSKSSEKIYGEYKVGAVFRAQGNLYFSGEGSITSGEQEHLLYFGATYFFGRP